MNLKSRKNLLIGSLALETLMTTFGLLIGETSVLASVLYPVAGLIFVWSIITLPVARLPLFGEMKNRLALKSLLLAIMVILAFVTARFWFDTIPIDPDYADMLPIIKVMNERFLHGNWKQVYDPIAEIWHGTRPIYMPAMWLPYAPAVALGFDMRWVTVGAVIIGFSIILSIIRLGKKGFFGYALILIAAMLFWWLFAGNDIHGLLSMSEEGVIILYFVLLCLAIISDNTLCMGVMVGLCLLSRYSMIGWLAPCLYLFFIKREWKRMIIFSGSVLLCIVFLFIIPFGWNAVEQMIALPGKYITFAKSVWENSPEVFWVNLGLAKFYGPDRIFLLHRSLIIMSFTVPVLFVMFCRLQKKWTLNNISLACFKLSLLVFYQFIDVPYGYLFYTCSFVSITIAACLLFSKTEDAEKLKCNHYRE